jgi:curved DNA-binding protein CbpA
MMSVESFPREHSQIIKPAFSIEELSAYYLELERLLSRVEQAVSHYQVLEVDSLATTNEIKLSFLRASALLNPAYYGIEIPHIEGLLPRIDVAFDKVSKAFSILVNFSKRMEYDNQLFCRPDNVKVEEKRFSRSAEVLDEMIEDEIARQATEHPATIAPIVNRRRYERFRLSIPVRVNGFSPEADEWQELTQSVDVSRGGVLLKLHRMVEEDNILYLTMPLPVKLRNYDYFDTSYSVYAIVRWAHHPEEGVWLAGLEFLGEQPVYNRSSNVWDSAIQAIDSNNIPLKKKSKVVSIEYFNQSLDYIKRESAFAEDLSPDGLRVCVKEPPSQFELVRVTSRPDSFESFATVTNRYVGNDGFERLVLQFIENEWTKR